MSQRLLDPVAFQELGHLAPNGRIVPHIARLAYPAMQFVWLVVSGVPEYGSDKFRGELVIGTVRDDDAERILWGTS